MSILEGSLRFRTTAKEVADLLRRLRRNQEALATYERALSLSANAVERRYLRRRMAELSNV
jgi:predicted RNA polymerase sigma factor